MLETRKVKLSDIKYDGRTSYLSVCGAAQLQQFARGLGMNCYDAASAPTEWEVEITANFDDVESILNEAQRVTEEELGLTITSYRIFY